MKWNDFLQVLRVRAIEESDARDDAWDAATMRAVTLESRLDPVARASVLLQKSRAPHMATALRVPRAPGWLIAGGALAALVAGWWFAALGQEREVNLLALPLIAILLWNAVILVFSLLHGMDGKSGEKPSPSLERMLERFGSGSKNSPAEDAGRIAAIQAKFHSLAWPPLMKRLGFRFRAWLHLAAALFAFGSVTGMYARGWSTEYRAVWESTLLGDSGAQLFFRVLFTPASKITGVAIPLDDVPSMRRRTDKPAASPGAALPWIHLYAATLGLLVIVPRLLFAGLELSRSDRVPAREFRTSDWGDYLAGLRASVEGDGTSVEVLAYAFSLDDAARERWRRLARSRWRDAGGVECRTLAPGNETDFVSAWSPAAPRVLMVFNSAITPESEVHRTLVEEALAKLRQSHPAAPLLLVLDDTELKKRWSGFADADSKLETRAANWREVMRGVAADWI